MKESKNNDPEIFSFSLSHHLASQEQIDRWTPGQDQLQELLARGFSEENMNGFVLLSTCHRIEFFGLARNVTKACEEIADRFATICSADPSDVENDFTVFRGGQAVRRLLEISAGLDSTAMGENEILGQVKKARLQALENATGDVMLDQLFERAVQTGKRVRHETEIGNGSPTIPLMTVRLLEQQLRLIATGRGDEHNFREDTDIALFGAGEFSARILQRLVKAGFSRITVINRCTGKARKLAGKYGCNAESFSGADEVIRNADVFITTTSSKDVLLTESLLEGRLQDADERPVWLIDLSIPHNIEPELENRDGVELITLTTITDLIESTRKTNGDEIAHARRIVSEEEEKFDRMQRMKVSRQVIDSLRRDMDSIRRKHVELHARRFSPMEYDQLQRFSRSLTQALMHKLTNQLSTLDPDEISDRDLATAAAELFDLVAENSTGSRNT